MATIKGLIEEYQKEVKAKEMLIESLDLNKAYDKMLKMSYIGSAHAYRKMIADLELLQGNNHKENMNKAYKSAGHNAYFANGFYAGIESITG